MSPTMYYQTKVMSELFLDSSFADDSGSMREATQMTDFWKVMLNCNTEKQDYASLF